MSTHISFGATLIALANDHPQGACKINQHQHPAPRFAGDDAGKQWQEVSTQSVQTDDAKGDVRSFGSQDILSNGNGMRYLQKRRKEEEGTEGI